MGFMHGGKYFITSAFDGTVFDVKKKKTKNGTRVLTWNYSGQSHQMWNANAESGGFRLSAAHVTDDIQVLDQEHGSSRVIIFQFQGGDNQLWNAFPVSHHHDIFYIKNVRTGLVIRNMGRGQQMECTLLNQHDPNTHWRITRV